MIVLDTDHLSVLLDERDARHAPLRSRLRNAGELLAIPIVGVEEQLRAWLAKINRVNKPELQIGPYSRLKKVFTLLREWPILEWNDDAVEHYSGLRWLRHRTGTQDLKIACIALANDALLLSANLRDFEQVPGLRVEDWLE